MGKLVLFLSQSPEGSIYMEYGGDRSWNNWEESRSRPKALSIWNEIDKDKNVALLSPSQSPEGSIYMECVKKNTIPSF